MRVHTKSKLSAVLIASALTLGACSGSSDNADMTPVVPASNPITVTPSLGQFSAGTVVVAFRPDGTTEIARGTVDASGVARIELGAYTGAVVATVQGGTGVTYFDEHTGANAPFPAGQTLSAVVPRGLAAFGVTPLTEAVKQQLAAATGGIAAATDAGITSANKTVAAAFGLSDALTPPALIKDSSTKNTDGSDAGRYALVLAVLAGSGNTGVPAHEAVAALARDFAADGKLDGKGAGGAGVGQINVADLSTNFGAKLAAAANTFAKPEVAALVKAEVDANLVVLVTTPKAPDASTDGIKAARDVIADVRVSLSVAEGQLRSTGQALADAVAAVNDGSRLGLEHYELLARGGSLMRMLLEGDTHSFLRYGAPTGGWQRHDNPKNSRPGMDCFSNAVLPMETTRLTCFYARRQGRNAASPSEWSRFRIAFSRGENAGDIHWDASAQTSTNGTFTGDDLAILAFGSEKDGTLHIEFSGDESSAQNPLKAKLSAKGAMPYGMGALATDKQELDLSVDATLADLSTGVQGSGSIAGSLVNTIGDKTAKLEFLPDSKFVADEAKNSVVANFGLKGTVGAYTLTGTLNLTDTGTLYATTPTPSTAKFTGSVVGTGGDSASIEASITVKMLDTITNWDAGTVSLAAKVLSKDGVSAQLAVGMDSPEAGKHSANVTVTQQLISGTTERKLNISGKVTDSKLDGTLSITANRNGLAVTATITRGADGKLTGTIKAGDQEVGTVSGTQINFKDGSTESLG